MNAKPNTLLTAFSIWLLFGPAQSWANEDNRTAKLWQPVEWTYNNNSCSGNPFDLVAEATFYHEDGRQKIHTELFYNGRNEWKLRFTGTRTGKWTFVTKSSDPQLNGHKGSVMVGPNDGVAGFMTSYGNKWGRLGLNEAFVPQYIMFHNPYEIYKNPEIIDKGIQTFFVQHGFNGFNTSGLCRWFDITKLRYSEIASDNPNPDPRTFEALELLIKKAHAAGGVTHIWAWGDEQRKMTPIKWRMNGAVDKRLQRYICARLGPLPGWSMCYGFDLQEWVKKDDLRRWHEYMHQHLGWFHFLGGRSPKLDQIYHGLDYSSYQQHRPSYETYVRAIEILDPGKPSFLEDRFRVRKNVYPDKDYDPELTRRGLWHSTMAGGAANIWGHLLDDPRSGYSAVYPNKHQILTYAKFFKHRFKKQMVRDNSLTNGVCLTIPGQMYVFYKEDTKYIKMNLGGMKKPRRAIAVDTKKEYCEIDLGRYNPGSHIFNAPYKSDWAVVVE